MTKEEAKLVLDNARPQTKEIDRQFYDDEDLNNALDMAIKALEQQSDDCVSRKSLLDKLDPLYEEKIKTAPDNMAEGFVQIANLIKNEPPVTPSQDWIPVSEGLPKPQKDGDSNFTDWVQVSIRINPYQSIVCSAYYCFSEAKWYMERMGCGEIVAWQPLPKAYEEKRGNKNDI